MFGGQGNEQMKSVMFSRVFCRRLRIEESWAGWRPDVCGQDELGVVVDSTEVMEPPDLPFSIMAPLRHLLA